MASRTTAAFLSGLSAAARPAFDALEDLDGRVSRWLAQAREAHPDVKVRPDAFATFLASKTQATDAPELTALAIGDLFLAWAARAEDPAAQTAVEAQVRTLLQRESRGKETAAELREVAQVVARILYVSEGKRRAALEGYSGRGPLGGWLRVISLRELLRVRKAKQRDDGGGDDALAELVSPDDDPELKFLKQKYRAEFKAAFAAAMLTLGERERNLLRHHFIDGLTIDDLCERFDVHRATVARWLVKAKEDASKATRTELKRRLELSSKELDSLARLVITRLELTLGPLK